MLTSSKSYIKQDESKIKIIERFLSNNKIQFYLNYIKDNDSLNEEYFYNKIEGVFEEIKEDLLDLFKIFNISLKLVNEKTVIDHETWWYECKALNKKDLDICMPLFFLEFSLYPTSFIRKLELKSIYFTSDITFSTSTYSQYRAAIPDYWENVMGMVYCCKERSVSYIRNTFHHELFHFFDYVEDGIIYGPDAVWDKLNIEGFVYGNGGANNRVWKPLDPGVIGFLNFYSTTANEEDKAEIYAFVMNNPDQSSSQNCPVIRNKIDYVKSKLKNYDQEGFGSRDYWDWLIVRKNEQLRN